MKIEREIAEFIVDNCMTFSDPPMLGLLPGDRYSSIIQNGPLLMNGPLMAEIAYCFHVWIECFFEADVQLAGSEPNALPIISYINAHRMDRGLKSLNAFWVRSSRKTYGPHNMIEGKPNDKPVFLVADMANSTNTFYMCELVCRKLGLQVCDGNFAILNKNNHDDTEFFRDKFSQKHIYSILTYKDLRDVLEERK